MSKSTVWTNTRKERDNNSRLGGFDKDNLRFVFLISSMFASYLIGHAIVGDPPVAEVGDMLRFNLDTASVTAPITAVPARVIHGPWAAPGRVCTLDVPTMIEPGGVISVTAVRSDGVMFDWAGGPTAPGQADCQDNAEILVKDEDYQRLQMAQAPRLHNPR
jgi:hypothetical protein